MRTIVLPEQQTTPCQLSKAELGLLLGAQRNSGAGILSVGLAPAAGEDFYQVRTGSIVGTLAWPELQVQIRPKVDLANLFFLLSYGLPLVEWRDGVFPYEQSRDLFLAVAAVFELELRRALRYGLARGYIDREEPLAGLRGRLLIDRQLIGRQGQAIPLECRFQEHTEDVPLNRVIKAALRRLTSAPLGDHALSRRLRQVLGAFTEVEDADYAPSQLPAVVINRLNNRWEGALKLAELILNGESLRDEAGSIRGTAFVVDMNKLFERFLEEVVRAEATHDGFAFARQSPQWLTADILMRPDLVISRRGTKLAVGDAKYIELEGWPHANLYQMLAYCISMGLPRGLLIYANTRPLEAHRVLGQDVELEIMGIDMSAEPPDLLRQARVAARRLVAHAKA